MMRTPSHIAAVARLLPVLLALLLPLPLLGQDALAVGGVQEGVLDASDPEDPESFAHVLVPLAPDAAGRVVITLESPDFDAFLEWGVLVDGELSVQADADDATGLPSPTDARLHLHLEGGETTHLRVSSLGAEGGSYTLRMVAGTATDPAPVPLVLGTPVEGALEETDRLEGPRFQDLFHFDGTAGERALLALEADFDAYLQLRSPEGTRWRNDDGFGGRDAFLEVDLPLDGRYELVVTAWGQEVGDYTLRSWTAPALVPTPVPPEAGAAGADPAAGGLAFTEAEKAGLQINNEAVWNDAVGFSFPSPGSDFFFSPEATEQLGLDPEAVPNVWGWTLSDALDTSAIIVMALKVPGPATEEVFAAMTGNMSAGMLGAMVQDAEVVFQDFQWDPDRSFEQGVDGLVEGEEGRVEMRCTASGPERAPAVVVCLMGISTDGWSFIDQFRGLEVR